MKKIVKNMIFWGVAFLVTAVLLILLGLNVIETTSLGETPVGIVLSAVCLVCSVWELSYGRAYALPLLLAVIFLCWEGGIAKAFSIGVDGNIIDNWIVIVAAILVTAGVALIVKSVRKKDRPGTAPDPRYDSRRSSRSISMSELYFDGASLVNGDVSEMIGNVSIFISNKERYRGGGSITVRNNIGVVSLHIPAEWQVISDVRSNVGPVRIPDHETAEGAVSITLRITENIGPVEVVYD